MTNATEAKLITLEMDTVVEDETPAQFAEAMTAKYGVIARETGSANGWPIITYEGTREQLTRLLEGEYNAGTTGESVEFWLDGK